MYHIISYHIISYHISYISYIVYHISYHIISYHIISYHIISYYIILYYIILYYIILYYIILYYIIHTVYLLATCFGHTSDRGALQRRNILIFRKFFKNAQINNIKFFKIMCNINVLFWQYAVLEFAWRVWGNQRNATVWIVETVSIVRLLFYSCTPMERRASLFNAWDLSGNYVSPVVAFRNSALWPLACLCWSRWPCCLRRRSAAAWLWDRDFESRWRHGFSSVVFVVCCAGSDLYDRVISRSEESYRLWCVV